ncbi:hypothetical protein BMH30_08080, partial [Leucobacter sp. OLES1]
MSITIRSSFLPLVDAEASLAFYRDALGFEVRLDVGHENMRWITVGPVDQPDTAIVLHPPLANPGLTEEEGRTLMELIAKGSYFGANLSASDLDATFARPTADPWAPARPRLPLPRGARRSRRGSGSRGRAGAHG